MRLSRLAAVSGILLFAGTYLQAQDIRITLEPVITSGLASPVYITHAHDGTNRRFILEQAGIISVMQPGSPSRTTFLDIRSRVISGGERGLLGLAFHPQFSSNGRFFVDYTRSPDGATVIAEYQVSPANPNAASTVEKVLLLIPQPFENHNGGMVEFGPDGYLYIGMGDGGSANDPQNRAQNRDELLGKILRIDVDSAVPPPTNPYAGDIPGRDEIYAIGMRNPWRFSFDRMTGQLYAGDVGQDQREEVDIVTAGGNYGWRVLEGTRCTGLGPAACSAPDLIPPVAEYSHATNGRCSITGGYVYRGSQQSLPSGAYVYGDYCSGEIFMYQGGVASVLLDTEFNISSFGEDQDGELYVVNHGGGIYRIRNPNATAVTTRAFGIADHGSVSFSTEAVANLVSGYGRIQADAGSLWPAGIAIFNRRTNGVLVSEASVPATAVLSNGRIYTDTEGRTGIAVANPNNTAVTLDFFFTDPAGNDFGAGSITVAANAQLAGFVDELPFSLPTGTARAAATFTFASSQPVSVIALQGVVNARGDFLMSTLPVVNLSAPPPGRQIIPHFASGAGWITKFELVNPTDTAISGSIETFDSSGQTASLLPPVSTYSIPPRSAVSFSSPGPSPGQTSLPVLQVGSLRITPSPGSAAPSAAAIFTLTSDGLTPVSQGGIVATPPATVFRMFVESLGTDAAPGSIHTGVAVANPWAVPVSISFEVFASSGASTGLKGSISIPPNGQSAVFLRQIPGLADLPARFQGVLRIIGNAPVNVAGLRGHYSEDGRFLFAATPPVVESSSVLISDLFFPQVVTGGGYDMEFALFSAWALASSGTVYFFDSSGNPLSLPIC